MNRLKELRSEFGYTVRDIEGLTGFNFTSVSSYEIEKRKMCPSILICFADLYQVTIDYLLCYKDLGIYVIDKSDNILLLEKKEFNDLKNNGLIDYRNGKRYLRESAE